MNQRLELLRAARPPHRTLVPVIDNTGHLNGGPAGGCGSSSTGSAQRPYAQLRCTDIDGYRFTTFAADAKKASSPS
jgi:hypothetical protein